MFEPLHDTTAPRPGSDASAWAQAWLTSFNGAQTLLWGMEADVRQRIPALRAASEALATWRYRSSVSIIVEVTAVLVHAGQRYDNCNTPALVLQVSIRPVRSRKTNGEAVMEYVRVAKALDAAQLSAIEGLTVRLRQVMPPSIRQSHTALTPTTPWRCEEVGQ